MEGSPGGNTLLILWVNRSRKNPAAFIFVVCPSRTNPAGFKRIEKQYVLEPRFGADSCRRNPAVLKWRDQLGVKPCLSFRLTTVAKIRPLLYIYIYIYPQPLWYQYGTPPWPVLYRLIIGCTKMELHPVLPALYQIWNSTIGQPLGTKMELRPMLHYIA